MKAINEHHDFPCEYDVVGIEFKILKKKIRLGKFKNAQKFADRQKLFHYNPWTERFRICIYPFAVEIDLYSGGRR